MGITNKKIAEYMNIGERTVKTHIANIYNKLGIKSKLELVNKLMEFNASVGFPQLL
ncbi:MAG: helix-turn-helix transcriptional regulator [Spirochaetales bacterium]|nr:helix-turn-helix transcriptional regulator [Spirochaetales bacterium]